MSPNRTSKRQKRAEKEGKKKTRPMDMRVRIYKSEEGAELSHQSKLVRMWGWGVCLLDTDLTSLYSQLVFILVVSGFHTLTLSLTTWSLVSSSLNLCHIQLCSGLIYCYEFRDPSWKCSGNYMRLEGSTWSGHCKHSKRLTQGAISLAPSYFHVNISFSVPSFFFTCLNSGFGDPFEILCHNLLPWLQSHLSIFSWLCFPLSPLPASVYF